jgi:hypothetical protein
VPAARIGQRDIRGLDDADAVGHGRARGIKTIKTRVLRKTEHLIEILLGLVPLDIREIDVVLHGRVHADRAADVVRDLDSQFGNVLQVALQLCFVGVGLQERLEHALYDALLIGLEEPAVRMDPAEMQPDTTDVLDDGDGFSVSRHAGTLTSREMKWKSRLGA